MESITIPEEIITKVLELYRDELIPSGKFPAYELMKAKLHSAKCVNHIWKIWTLFENKRRSYEELDPVVRNSIEHICMLLETISGVEHEIQKQNKLHFSRESLITMITDEIMNSIV